MFCVVSVLSVYTCTFVIVLFVVLHLQADNGGEFHGAAYSAKEEANVTVGELSRSFGNYGLDAEW